ncbi:MAG: ABC transporter ATP-binding protein [Gammaproteobacteria bacterium]|nr:MAG: ABC transporter ATP-binding protein [Gammaproteobacteria bacterium]
MAKALTIRNLKKTYTNGLEALKGVSLDVEEGDFFALLGPNGAGKSTTIGIICSLVTKTSGSVEIFGHDIDTDFSAAKRQLGLVPQEFNFNVFEPVEEILVNQAGYFGIERKTAFVRAEQYLKQLGLWEKRRVQARELSGGMKRRLMIARSLMHRPRLLILDEPTAGVDIEIRRSMWNFMRELNRSGTTIILTTHYLEEAESLCRNIAIIDEGELIENTSVKHLLSQLQTETFVLDIRSPITALPAMNRPSSNGDCLRLIDETTLEADISKDCSINFLFEELSKSGIEVLSMRNKTNRLEQLFVHLVENGAD